MSALQEITHRGKLAAVVVGDQAIVRPHVTDPDRPIVEAMCLYAIEVRSGDRPGPYSDQAAEQYARAAERLHPR